MHEAIERGRTLNEPLGLGMTPPGKLYHCGLEGILKQLFGFYGKGYPTKRKYHTAEQIVSKLRLADAVIASGDTLEQVCKQLGISDATDYNWRRQYGQMKLDQVKNLKSLQKENVRLRKYVADLSLHKAILEETLQGNY
jgi:transposase-like protein